MTADPLTHPSGATAPAAAPAGGLGPQGRLPFVVYVLAVGTFLMLTTEFVVAGLLPEIAGDLRVGVGQAGLLITVFAVGMIVDSPTMALLTRRMPPRTTLVLALGIFAAGHVVVALGSSFPLPLGARFVTAWATGAFWSVASVVATRAAGPAASSRALGLVGAGGMLANVAGVPLGALAGQLSGWRGPFWALAALALVAVPLIARHVPREDDRRPTSLRSELGAMRSGRLWLALAACATTTGGVLSAYSFVSPLLTDRAGIAPGWLPLVVLLVVLLGLLGLSPTRCCRRSRSASPASHPRWVWRCPWRRTTSAPRSAPGSPGALDSGLGATGPGVVGVSIAALTLVPTVALARLRRADRPASHRVAQPA